MNTLVKLFIVLIFIASIMFMSLSVVIYATHTNWREHAAKLDTELKAKTSDLAALKKAKADMETELNVVINTAKDRNTALQEKVAQIENENKGLKDGEAALEEKLALQVAAVKAAGDTTETLRQRYDAASTALLKAQEEWANMASELTAKIDETHSLALRVATYQSVTTQLAQDYKDAVDVLKKHNLSADPVLYESQPPAGIRGIVTEVRPKGMIELSVGSDSGLVKGHKLDVVRNLDGRSSYVGKVEIVETAPDRSVAKVLPEFRRGTVQKDDEVQYIDINTLTAK